MGPTNLGSLSASPALPPRLSGRVFAPNGKPQPAAVIFAIEAPLEGGGSGGDDDNESRSSKHTENDRAKVHDTPWLRGPSR